jgi:hypothetical protein
VAPVTTKVLPLNLKFILELQYGTNTTPKSRFFQLVEPIPDASPVVLVSQQG